MDLQSDKRTFVLKNVPADWHKEYIEDFLEGIFDKDVEIRPHPVSKEIFLIIFQEDLEDPKDAVKKVENEQSFNISLEPTTKDPTTVVLGDLDLNLITEELLRDFLQVSFAKGEDVPVILTFSSTMAIAEFKPNDKDVVKNILDANGLKPLPFTKPDYLITSEPFYKSFHAGPCPKIPLCVSTCETLNTSSHHSPEYGMQLRDQITETSNPGIMNDYQASSDVEGTVDQSEKNVVTSEQELSATGDASAVRQFEKHPNTGTRISGSKQQHEKSFENGASAHICKDSEVRSPTECQTKQDESLSDSATNSSQSDVSRNMQQLKQHGGTFGQRGKRGAVYKHNNRRLNTPNVVNNKTDISNDPSESEARENESIGLTGVNSIPIFGQNVNRQLQTGMSRGSNMFSEPRNTRGARGSRGGKGAVFIPKRNSSSAERNSMNIQDEHDCDVTRSNNPSPGDAMMSRGSNMFSEPRNTRGARGSRGGKGAVFIPKRNSFSAERNTMNIQDEHDRYVTRSNNPLPGDAMTSPREDMTSSNLRPQRQAVIDNVSEDASYHKNVMLQYSKTLQANTIEADLLKPFFDTDRSCKVYYNSKEGFIKLEGNKDDVDKLYMTLLDKQTDIHTEAIQLSSNLKHILLTERGTSYLQDQMGDCEWKIVKKTLHIFSSDRSNLNQTVQYLKEQLNGHAIIDVSSLSEALQETACEVPNSKYLVLIEQQDSKLIVEGVKDDVAQAQKYVDKLLENHGEFTMEHEEKGLKADFFNRFLSTDFHKLIEKHNVKIKNFISKNINLSVSVSGNKSAVKSFCKDLKDTFKKINTKQYLLKECDLKKEDAWLISKSLEDDEMRTRLKIFEEANNCLVRLDVSQYKRTPADEASTNQARQTRNKSPRKHERHQGTSIVQDPSKEVVNATPTCEIHVKPYGDIIQEKSDILVCVLNDSMDLRKTRVGQAFNKACHSLWQELNMVKDTNPSASVMMTSKNKGKLPCKAIAHVILKPWNTDSSESLLDTVIQQVLSQADALGGTSVSFPALGCGRALKYPETVVVKTALSAVKNYLNNNPSSGLKKIVFLAPDKELFQKFKTSLPNHFFPSQHLLGAIGGIATSSANPNLDQATDDDEDDDDDDDDDDDYDDDDDEDDNEDDDDSEILKIETPQHESEPNIILVVKDSNVDTSKLRQLLKTLFNDYCLYTTFFNQESIDYWPKRARNSIKSEAVHHQVIVRLSKNPKTHYPGYMIKGKKDNALMLKDKISREYHRLVKDLPAQSLTSSKAPKRGTPEFVSYASRSDQQYPSYWKMGKKIGNFEKLQNWWKKSDKKILVKVDSNIMDAIKRVISQTWVNRVGHGHDAQNLSHSKIKVIKVERVENFNLMERYWVSRKHLFQKMSEMKTLCPKISKIQGSTGNVATHHHLIDCLKQELYFEINEHYLFHGFKAEFQDTIIHNGLDQKVGSSAAMFGQGIYFAESATKADQYSDSKQNRVSNGTPLKMVLARVLLGNVFLCDDKHPTVQTKDCEKLKRPPCTKCRKDKCACNAPMFDSVMGDGKWIFREFVVYDPSHCYPEYIITYKRE